MRERWPEAAGMLGRTRADPAPLARELRGEAAVARRDVASARELVGEVGPDQEGAASSPLSRAEGEMEAAEYGLEAYATQQDLVSEGRLPGESRISQEELDRLGTGLTSPPPQGFWNIGTVGTGMEPAFAATRPPGRGEGGDCPRGSPTSRDDRRSQLAAIRTPESRWSRSTRTS
jgi:hypothetical protein